MLSHLKKLDWVLILVSVLLVAFGLLSLYSSSAKEGFLNFKKQIIFFAIGLILMFVLSFFDWRGLRDNSYLILAFYGLCLLALIGLFFFAAPIRGVKGWYKIGQFSFDPIEAVKIVLIILLAKYFSMRHIEMYRLRHILLSGFYTLLPSLLIFFQPNLGSAIILIVLWIGILVVSGIKLRHFLILVLCGLIITALGWQFFLKDYQRERVISFLMPQADPLGISWNQSQAEIAIGAGGIWGQGFEKGSQTRYGFLPEPQTDFIFAAIAEEFGLIGVSMLFLLYLVMVRRLIRIALIAGSNFPRFFTVGFIIILLSQIFVNIGMNLGVLPVIGIALPLVSYGGSGLLATFIGLGILQSVKSH